VKKIFLYSFLTALTCATSLLAQGHGVLDSLGKEANVLVYSNPELAIEKAFELYQLSNDDPVYQVNALLTVANGYAVLKEHDQVFEYALKADSIAEVHKNYTDQVRVLGFIGGQYQRLKLGGRALTYLDRAYNLSVKYPLPDSLEFIQGNILFVKGLIKKDDLGCRYALPYFNDAATVFENNKDKKTIYASLAIAYNNIGDCNFLIEEYTEAKKNYTKAIRYAEEINATKNIAYSKLGLAKLLSKEERYDESIKLLEKAFSSIKDVNDTQMNTQILKALSEDYAQVGNDEKYNEYVQLYLEEEKKLLEEEKKTLNRITDELEIESQEKSQNQKNTYVYIFLFIGIILFFLLGYVVNKIVKKRRKIAASKEKIKKSSTKS
tara:strand:+ start:108758 stop:109894 length:1137 start_codon:yes stop_codon:yes gene_type:complete